MNDIESCEILLTIKQLKLSVKFPCRLTFHHGGKSLTSEIASNATNTFAVNKDITIKQEKPKQYIQISINLATDKGGNIMAGIIKINLKDINSSEGQIINQNLQKCLDPYATCSLHIKSVKLNKSRIKNTNFADEKRNRNIYDSRIQTKSQAPIIDTIKPKLKYNQAEQFGSKIVTFNNTPTNYIKQKALSTAGFKVMKDSSFQKNEIGSRFKHLLRKQQQDSKTVITGRWRDTDQVLKSTMQANQKALKMEILKYKTKYEESDKNVEEKQKQIKNLKEQISQLNRQLSEKHYLIEQINIKNNQITKLQELNKSLSKEFHQERNKIIDLQRQIQQQKNQYSNQISKFKQEIERKQYQFQKQLYEKKQEIKQILQQNQYKINQIKKMKVLIEDLQRNLQMKGLQFQKIYSSEKNQHNKTKITLQNKITETNTQISKLQAENSQLNIAYMANQSQNQKMSNKLKQVQDILRQNQQRLELQIIEKQKIIDEKKIFIKNQEELSSKLKNLQRQYSLKEKQSTDTIIQINQLNNSNKKKMSELTDKIKVHTARIQQLQNKCNNLTASEEKFKRNLQLFQKQNKHLQENQKQLIKSIKIKDDRILQLERQLTDVENKINIKQNITKKDVQYKTTQIEKQNTRITELQKIFEKEKQQNQAKRLQILKTQNKIKMIQQANNRLNQQISQIKLNNTKKEDQLRSYAAQLTEQVRALQAKQNDYNKELHSLQMEKISLKNQISRLEKNIQNINEKLQRAKKRQNQLENSVKSLSIQIQSKNEELVDLQAQYRHLQNEYKLLQADKSKHQKITTIISQQKNNIKSDISKLKKQIEKRDQKEQQYLSEIKGFKQQITKIQLKLVTVTKDSQKFKANISESVKSVVALKQNYLAIDNTQTNLQLSRSFQRSRVLKSSNNEGSLGLQQTKFAEIIENFSRETHQNITHLNEELRKIKKERQSLEKQNASLNIRLKDSQQQLSKTVRDMSNQIQNIVSRTNEDSQQYEQKISYLQRQLNKKQKAISQMMNEIEQISTINQNQQSNHQISISDLLSKIESLKFKIVELQRKDQSNAQVFIQLQQKLQELQQYNMELSSQIDTLSQQIQRKDKIIQSKNQEYEEITEQIEIIKKYKTDLTIQLQTVKQNLVVQKQNSQRIVNQLKSEESKNSHLKNFQNQILKEKQSFLRKDFQKSQQMYTLQQKIQNLMVQSAQKNEQLSSKLKVINEQKQAIKQLQTDLNNLHIVSNDNKLNWEKEKQKLKQKERKIVQKDAQIQNLNNQIKRNITKYQSQIKKINEQNQSLSQQLNKQRFTSSAKLQEYESQLKTYKQNEKKINEYNISLQEQIFFEKQTNSLNISKIDELKQQISDLQIQSSRLNNQIIILSDQVKEKQENLFALSGKLFASDNRLQSKQEQFRQRIQKVELDWRYKLQEICQQYQHKLEIIEREKNYVRNGINDFSENIEKLEHDKSALKIEQQRQKQVWQLKIKRIQEQKLNALIDKNKQIQKLRELIEDLEEKIKKKQYQYKLIQDQKKKIQEKNRELKIELQKNQEKKNEGLRTLQKQIDQLKRKEGQLKRFKQALKNGQWTTQRQIKKNIQNTTKNIVNLAIQSSKGEIIQSMKNLQTVVIKLALPNIDEL